MKVRINGKLQTAVETIEIEWEDRPLVLSFHDNGETNAKLREDSEGNSDEAVIADLADLADNLGLAMSDEHADTLAGALDDDDNGDDDDDEGEGEADGDDDGAEAEA